MTTSTYQDLVVRLPTRGRVFNATLRQLADAGRLVKIDRSTAWGNPYVVDVDGDRDTVVASYALWLEGAIGTDVMPVGRTGRTVDRRWVLDNIGLLRGKALACWCAPLLCHGSVLARKANGDG